MPEDEDMQVVSLIKIMKTKGNGKDAMQKPDVFGVECVACTSSVFLKATGRMQSKNLVCLG